VVDKTAFQAVPSGTFGNAGRNILRGPDWQSLDLSLQKNLPVGRTNLNLRWDVFNVFNTVNLGLPDANISNTATVSPSRSSCPFRSCSSGQVLRLRTRTPR